MARSWSFDRLSTVKIQPQSGTFRASCENNNCRLPSIEKKTQKAVLIISLQPSKARRNAHAAQRRCAGGGGDASRPASASATSNGLEAPTTLQARRNAGLARRRKGGWRTRWVTQRGGHPCLLRCAGIFASRLAGAASKGLEAGCVRACAGSGRWCRARAAPGRPHARAGAPCQ